MNANSYQEWTRTTAIYPEAGFEGKVGLSYLALGLTSEAGEVAGKIKKYLRDGTKDDVAIIQEIGDCAWYLARLCSAFSIPFEDLLSVNAAKLNTRKEKGTLQGSGDIR